MEVEKKMENENLRRERELEEKLSQLQIKLWEEINRRENELKRRLGGKIGNLFNRRPIGQY